MRWLALVLIAAPLFAQECTYVVSPAGFSVPASETGGIARTIRIDVSRGGCAWTSRSNVDWITVTFGQAGTNDGTVGITVETNRDAAARTGSVTVGGQTVSVQQAAANCTFALNPLSAIASPAGGTGSFQVNTACNWSAITNVDWIDVTAPAGGRGVASGTVSYSVRANTATVARSGTIQVGLLRFTVQQPAGVCTQALNPSAVNLTAAGGAGTVQMTSSCAWTATSQSAWIAITGGASGETSGTVACSAQANTQAAARTGTVRIGNQTFTVNQAGSACAVALTPANVAVPANGSTGTIAVESACTWTAASNDAWIAVSAAGSAVTYTVAANNSGAARTGSIAIGNRIFTITQAAGGCAVTLSPAAAQVSTRGGAGSFLVSGSAGCRWTASSSAEWLTLNLAGGDGSGTVIYTAAANSGAARTASVNINAQAFAVTQAASIPAFTAAGVVNAASFQGGAISPGLIVTIFGSDLGPAELLVATVNLDTRSFPVEIGGTRVLFDGIAAPLLYASAGQTSAVVPFAVAERATTRMEVETQGVRSGAVALPVAAAAPAIFTQSAQGSGAGAILNQDFTVNRPGNAAAPGSFVFLFATGGGALRPAPIDGRLAEGISATLATVTAEVDGQPAEVVYAGGAPDLIAGVLQVNLRLPANLRPGNLPIAIRAGAMASQANVTVSVR